MRGWVVDKVCYYCVWVGKFVEKGGADFGLLIGCVERVGERVG